MKDIWTKLSVIFASLLFGLTLSTAVIAVEASNTETGSGSVNTATIDLDNDATITQGNTMTVNNNLTVNANTGKNSASNNTGDGIIGTGNINGSLTIETTGNENNFDPSSFSLGAWNYNASNTTTGSGSTNTSSIHADNDFNFTNTNQANINNNVDGDLNTGDNNANDNTGDGRISTGGINFNIKILTDINKNGIGAPTPEEGVLPPIPGVIPTPIITPTSKPQVLGAALPVTGGNLPNWPLLMLIIGFGLKFLEKIFRKNVAEKAT